MRLMGVAGVQPHAVFGQSSQLDLLLGPITRKYTPGMSANP